MQEYSHSWAYHPTSRRYRALWPVLLCDIAVILTHLDELGIAISGPDSTGEPICDASGIAFNGTAAQGSSQPLTLASPHGDPYPSPCGTPAATSGTCDTASLPYDLAVTAVLLRCHHWLGHDFGIRSSHARWDTEWLHGVRPGCRVSFSVAKYQARWPRSGLLANWLRWLGL